MPYKDERRAAEEAKKEVFFRLGGKCIRCGYSDTRALQVDHIEGGGGKELRKSGNKRHYYRTILRRNLVGYQLLCANCNWVKRYERSEGHRLLGVT